MAAVRHHEFGKMSIFGHVTYIIDVQFFPARKRGTCYGNVAGWLGGWLGGWLSVTDGIVSKRLNLS